MAGPELSHVTETGSTAGKSHLQVLEGTLGFSRAMAVAVGVDAEPPRVHASPDEPRDEER